MRNLWVPGDATGGGTRQMQTKNGTPVKPVQLRRGGGKAKIVFQDEEGNQYDRKEVRSVMLKMFPTNRAPGQKKKIPPCSVGNRMQSPGWKWPVGYWGGGKIK